MASHLLCAFSQRQPLSYSSFSRNHSTEEGLCSSFLSLWDRCCTNLYTSTSVGFMFCSFFGLFFICLFVLSYSDLFVFIYSIWFYYYLLDAFLFLFLEEREEGCGSTWKERWGETGRRSWGIENYNKKILCRKKSVFNYKNFKMVTSTSLGQR